MAEKQFIDLLGASAEDRIRCTFEARKGKVVKIKVVQYETFFQDKWHPVLRYDTAHGFFHRDVYLFKGKKHFIQFILKSSLEEALTYAIDDIRRNWKHYKQAFVGKNDG